MDYDHNHKNHIFKVLKKSALRHLVVPQFTNYFHENLRKLYISNENMYLSSNNRLVPLISRDCIPYLGLQRQIF